MTTPLQYSVWWLMREERSLKFKFESLPPIIGRIMKHWRLKHRGLLQFFLSLDYSKKPQGRNLKCQIFKIVLHWCLDLICHNVGTPLKHNKHIFDIPLPFCHNLYLPANLEKFLTEFAGFVIIFHVVNMWEHTQFLRAIWLVNLKKCCMKIWHLRFLPCGFLE